MEENLLLLLAPEDIFFAQRGRSLRVKTIHKVCCLINDKCLAYMGQLTLVVHRFFGHRIDAKAGMHLIFRL